MCGRLLRVAGRVGLGCAFKWYAFAGLGFVAVCGFVEIRAEAEYRMCAGLKLMCPVRIREARLIRNRLVWAVLKRVGRGVDLDSRGWRILRSGS